MELDRIDRKILDLLQDDGRITNQDLAERAGLSPAPCLRRVRTLEERGIIRKYVALLDVARVGITLDVIVDLRLKSQTREFFERFESRIVKLPEVMECCLVAGEWDYSLRVLAPDLVGYQSFLLDRLMSNESDIASFRTTIIMKKVKSSTKVELASVR
jgi:Lrp/AsnC family leucine-responsive transcriptional regulator